MDIFKLAKPVFALNKETEQNYTLVLRATIGSLAGLKLYISACSFYRLFINGHFIAFGPARTAEGYARVDEIALGKYGNKTYNEIIIEVAGYYCKSLSTVRQPSFVIAELRSGDDVILYTGRDFEGYQSAYRIQHCERYSAQRHFGEIWDFSEANPYDKKYQVPLYEQASPIFIPRVVPYPTYQVVNVKQFSSKGSFKPYTPKSFFANRYSFAIDEDWGCFPDNKVPHPFRYIQKQKMTHKSSGSLPITISENEFVVFDIKQINVGFFTLSVTAFDDCELVLGFTEYSSPKHFAFTNMNVQNVIEYHIKGGTTISTQSFEPYTARLAVLMVKRGSLKISKFGMRLFEYNRSLIKTAKVKDAALRRIRIAAENTFAHNALDLYTDCPSRERAGWLCDSFFTGRAEYFLTGKTSVEDAFLENFRLYRCNGELPKGALPMCYPADIQPYTDGGKWIPQWNLWYILEVCEYLSYRKPNADKELYKNSIYGILKLLAKYENQSGLLQGLPGWNFVEWSTANEWVQDINYPTNFLYSRALFATAKLYSDESLLKKSINIRETCVVESFDGEVFIDNAITGKDGEVHNTRNCSEAGQYYAMLFGELDLNSPQYSKLIEYLHNSFSSFDAKDRAFVPVNAFIGLYLRLWLLMELGERKLLAQNLKDFFAAMVNATSTLWEYKQHKGSYDHGFTSFAAITIAFAEENY